MEGGKADSNEFGIARRSRRFTQIGAKKFFICVQLRDLRTDAFSFGLRMLQLPFLVAAGCTSL